MPRKICGFCHYDPCLCGRGTWRQGERERNEGKAKGKQTRLPALPIEGWILVADAMPMASMGAWSEDVLVANDANVVNIDSYYHPIVGGRHGFWRRHSGEVTARPTHWMPLPDHPGKATVVESRKRPRRKKR